MGSLLLLFVLVGPPGRGLFTRGAGVAGSGGQTEGASSTLAPTPHCSSARGATPATYRPPRHQARRAKVPAIYSQCILGSQRERHARTHAHTSTVGSRASGEPRVVVVVMVGAGVCVCVGGGTTTGTQGQTWTSAWA